MGDVVIRVEKLGKKFRIGAIDKNQTLRDRIAEAAMAPFQSRSHRTEEETTIWALRDVSFEVRRGEVLGIIGRNGAGKSTLLKVLSRITRPTTGFAEVHGTVASLLEVGTGFHPELTGRENVFLSGAVLGMRRREIAAKFAEIVAFAEVERFIDTPVKRYSSGMYLRLAFAVAAFLEPQILIVDEVLAVGDLDFQKRCLGKMDAVARTGRTVLLVSHNMAAIRTLSSRVLWMESGRMRMDGEPSAVVPDYAGQGSSKGQEVIDLTRALRSGRRMGSVRLKVLSFNGGKPVHHGERATVEVTFEARDEARDVVVGVGINTVEGVRILSIDSDNGSAPVRVKAGAVLVARAHIEHLDLAPGRYLVDCAVRRSDGAMLDLIVGAGTMTVEPGSGTSPLFVRYGGGWRPALIWELEEVPASPRPAANAPSSQEAVR